MPPITINSNIASLQTQRQLTQNTASLSKTFERLSSGLRINRASDDAAGIAIADSLRVDTRVFVQGVRNLNDGLSLLSVADGAIEGLSNITIRLKELAEQASNGTYGSKQRKAVDAEAQALTREFSRLVQSTKYNGLNLFAAEFGSLRLQGGYGSNGGVLSDLGGALGTGTFGTNLTQTAAGSGYHATAIADVNGDGIPDLLGSTGSGVSVNIGNGDGTFRTGLSYSLGSVQINSLDLVDVNNDGYLDLSSSAYVSGVSTGVVFIQLGAGNGTFGTATSYTNNGSLYANDSDFGDLNGDGVLDMVTIGSPGGTSNYIVRLGRGDGTFGTDTSYVGGLGGGLDLALGDLNGDGILDLAIQSFKGNIPAGYLSTYLGRGDGTFAAYSVDYEIDGELDLGNLEFADLNHDGKLDLVLNGAESLNVLLGTGSGNFSAPRSYGVGNYTSFALGDVNGDGHLDLAVSSGTSSGVLLGNGNGSFTSAVTFLNGQTATDSVALADLDGNGVLDIVSAGTSGGGSIAARLANTASGISPLLSFDLSTIAGARQALPVFDQKLTQLNKQRGKIGALQSRVATAVNNLSNARENFASAESRIRDVDVADESSQLVRLNILQQSAAAILAKANLQPDLALTLLGQE